jgi:hypothetical protein
LSLFLSYKTGTEFFIPHLDAMSPGQKTLYELWRGIVFFWSLGGPVETGIMPKANASNTDENYSSKLRQSHIHKYKTALTKLLQGSQI